MNQPNTNKENNGELEQNERTTIFERFTESLKTFLDNAE